MATGYLSNAPRVGQEEDRPDGLGGAIGRPRAAPLAHALAPQRSQQQQRVTATLNAEANPIQTKGFPSAGACVYTLREERSESCWLSADRSTRTSTVGNNNTVQYSRTDISGRGGEIRRAGWEAWAAGAVGHAGSSANRTPDSGNVARSRAAWGAGAVRRAAPALSARRAGRSHRVCPRRTHTAASRPGRSGTSAPLDRTPPADEPEAHEWW